VLCYSAFSQTINNNQFYYFKNQQSMKRIFMFMGVCTVLFVISCTSHHEKEEAESKFLVTSPLKQDTSIVQEYVCQIHSINHIELRSQERGFLEKIFVDEGDFVKKGQLLFRIMPKLYEAEMHKAKAEADLAAIEFQNTKSLSDSNIVSKNELAMAKARYERAKAELKLSQVHLGFTEIRAPFDGYIDRFQVRLGSLLDEGDVLTNLSDNSSMWVYFNVPESEYLDLMEHVTDITKMDVSLKMANNKLFQHPGVVETIEADFNNETGNIPFRATFPNPNGLLRHGETGNIRVTRQLKDALIIPQKATFEVLEKKFVFVVDDENTLRSREITIGEELPHLFVITGGLNEGDKILLEGLRKVKNNEEIDFELVSPKKVINQLELYSE
jgi:membrane fusion protein, multidrug efflux system